MSYFVVRWLKISLVVIVGCGFLAMMIYALVNRDEISSSQIEPPLINAPSEPLKKRPDQPGGMQIPNRDKLVFDLLDSSNTTLGETGVAVPMAEVSPVAVSATVVSQTVNVEVVQPSVNKPMAEVTPAIVKVVPVVEVAQPVVEPQKVVPKIEASFVKKALTKDDNRALMGGKWGVQLAAVNSVADGNGMVAKAQKDFPVLKNLAPKVSAVPGAKKYRVQFVGLKDRNEAAAVCAKLAGKQGCFPVGGQ